ncbi:MAG: DNA alkylation repair protein [Planctomycetes bacterium]|nr:DNA alkylation repair protein [Planctomycetota bacterium]
MSDKKSTAARASSKAISHGVKSQVEHALAWLERKSTKRDRENLSRFAITTTQSFGVSMANMRVLAKEYGRSHELAAALWDTGWYEARMLATLVDEPERVKAAQMDRWCKDFDNWAICDTACMHLFDRTPHAWRKIEQWRRRKPEFEKRAAFALLASVALHDKSTDQAPFTSSLKWIEEASDDPRNFVKKSVNWALRAVGGRSAILNAAAIKLAKRLAQSQDSTPRWIGKDALKQLTGPALIKRFSSRDRRLRDQ